MKNDEIKMKSHYLQTRVSKSPSINLFLSARKSRKDSIFISLKSFKFISELSVTPAIVHCRKTRKK